MTYIGPELPAHLTQHRNESSESTTPFSNDSDEEASAAIGPQIPAHLPVRTSQQIANDTQEEQNKDDQNDDDDEDAYMPSLPPGFLESRTSKVASPDLPQSRVVKRVLGPSLPGHDRYRQDDDDDDYGPKPNTGYSEQEDDGVREFMEKEEKRRKEAEEAAKPKALKRDEWMIVPPTSNILSALGDPLKLKARQFSQSTKSTSSRSAPNNLWTETPQERQQRIADEVSGKKRRAANQEPEVEDQDARKRMKGDEEVRRVIEGHNKSSRNKTLLEMHSEESSKVKKSSDEPEVYWDHSRDMSMGGRLMDDGQRKKLINDAKGLGERFGTGKSGGYL